MARNIITITNQDSKTIQITDKVTGNAVSVETSTTKQVKAQAGSTQVNINRPITSTIQITRGQGPRGIQGIQGPPGELSYFQDLSVTGSVFVSQNITASIISASSGITGSLFGTASFADDATSASYSTDATSASFAQTASKVTIEEKELDAGGLVFALRANSGVVTEADFKSATGRNVTIFTATNPITPTADVTEFRIGNSGRPGGINILNASGDPAYVKTNASDLYLLSKKGLYLSGSNITALDPITGSLEGTASFADDATSASYALTASYAGDAVSASYALTASYADDAVSASFATTSSFTLNVPKNVGFPFSGSAELTGSLDITGSITSSGVISASGGFTGSLEGTSSFAYDATSASYALTSSFALNVPDDTGFPFTGSAVITGSLHIIGATTASNDISASGFISASDLVADSLTVDTLTADSLTVNTPFNTPPSVEGNTELILSSSETIRIKSPVLNLSASVGVTTGSISQPRNGYIVYDNDQNKFFGYANGDWVALH